MTHDDGRRLSAINHASDSGDLNVSTCPMIASLLFQFSVTVTLLIN